MSRLHTVTQDMCAVDFGLIALPTCFITIIIIIVSHDLSLTLLTQPPRAPSNLATLKLHATTNANLNTTQNHHLSQRST